jgi:surfeit locus 1 family protein
VNRGFVPQDRRGKDQRDPAPEGAVAITGLLRPDDTRNWFTPEDRPADGLYFARSIAAIGTGLQVEAPLAPFTIDLLASETPPSGFPQAGETRMAFTNNHLGYAFTWYGLAAALLAVFAASIWGRLRSPPETMP